MLTKITAVYVLWLSLIFNFAHAQNDLPSASQSGNYKSLPRHEINTLNVKLQRAMTLYYDNQFILALPLLQDIAKKLDTIDVLFWLGRAASQSQKPDIAINSFKKILSRDPSLLTVRLELAIAYIQNGQDILANEALDLIQNTNPAESIQLAVKKIKASILPPPSRWLFSANTSLGMEYDDNINIGPNDDTITLPGGNGFLTADNVLRGWLLKSIVNTNLAYQFQNMPNFVWRSRLNFLHHEYQDSPRDDFNYTRIDLNSGFEYYATQFRIRLPFGFVNQRFSNEELSRIFYLTPDFEYALNSHLKLDVSYRFELESFDEQANKAQDNTSHTVNISPRFQFNTEHSLQLLSLNTGFAVKEASAERFSYDEWSLAPSYFIRLTSGTELSLLGRYANRRYDSPALLFENSGDRHDKRLSATAVIRQYFQKYYYISASYSYIRNDSNIALFDYTKSLVAVNIGVNITF